MYTKPPQDCNPVFSSHWIAWKTHKITQKTQKTDTHRERRIKPEEEPFQEGVALQPRVQQRLRWSGGPRVLKLRQLLMHLLHRRSPFSTSASTSNSSDNATAHCDMDDKPPKPRTLQILQAIRTRDGCASPNNVALCLSVPLSPPRCPGFCLPGSKTTESSNNSNVSKYVKCTGFEWVVRGGCRCWWNDVDSCLCRWREVLWMLG